MKAYCINSHAMHRALPIHLFCAGYLSRLNTDKINCEHVVFRLLKNDSFLIFCFRVRTPRPSRPPSEETVPLHKPSTGIGGFLSPGDAAIGGGSRPSSRPASLLLRDALITMFAGTEEE